MKIGVISDSHKNIEYLRNAIDHLKDIEKVDEIIHLGDDYSDIDQIKGPLLSFLFKFTPIIRVPGVYDPEYKDPKIMNRAMIEHDGWKFFLSHTLTKHENDLPEDIDPELASTSLGVDVFLYGHTHIPKIEEKGRIFYINPGHLKDDDKRGFPPSFAVLDIAKEEIKVKIIGLKDKKVLDEISILSVTD